MEQQMQKLFQQIKEEMDKQTITLTNTMDTKLDPIIKENQQLKEEIITLKSKIHSLEKTSKKNKFILHGIAETVTENTSDLMEKVTSTLNTLSESAKLDTWDKWEISNVQRLGEVKEGKKRPIAVSVTLEWRKMEVLRNNKQFPATVYATDDYPKEVLDKRRELKTKMQEEINKGKIAFIRYDKLIVREPTNEKRKRSPTTSPVSEPNVKNDASSSTSTPTGNRSKVTKPNVFSQWRSNAAPKDS